MLMCRDGAFGNVSGTTRLLLGFKYIVQRGWIERPFYRNDEC